MIDAMELALCFLNASALVVIRLVRLQQAPAAEPFQRADTQLVFCPLVLQGQLATRRPCGGLLSKLQVRSCQRLVNGEGRLSGSLVCGPHGWSPHWSSGAGPLPHSQGLLKLLPFVSLLSLCWRDGYLVKGRLCRTQMYFRPRG